MKIRNIKYFNHHVLGDLNLDFTDQDGNVLNTIIFAGENGTGKSLILDTIFNFSTFSPDKILSDEKIIFEIEISFSEYKILGEYEGFKTFISNQEEFNRIKIEIDYSKGERSWKQLKSYIITSDESLIELPFGLFGTEISHLIMRTIFSDVEINYNPKTIQTITSKNIDSDNLSSFRSTVNLATEISQLLIDVDNIDASDLQKWVKDHSEQVPPQEIVNPRIRRFTKAFEFMFPQKKYSRIVTTENHKEILFSENGVEMNISQLSSGEKQIVFRGSFLLKDQKSTEGALILIDEPEISMHPRWQKKILPFYKMLFTSNREQTSQLIVATHSPFIIHNDNRNEDKVIILLKRDDGQISIAEEPQFIAWTKEERVKRAFNVSSFISSDIITVFVEGKTDEKYFHKALEIFKCDTNKIQFEWIGRINEAGGAEFTGKGALDSVGKYYKANPSMLNGKVVLLYDCDVNKAEEVFGDLKITNMTKNSANTIYNIGIENLLELPYGFEREKFIKERPKTDKYSVESIIRELHKSGLCNYVCDELPPKEQKTILVNLKLEIDKLVK